MAKPILIKRAQHDKDNPYFMCRREPAQDRELSWEARGMLWYLLSKPDDWKVQPKDLEQQCAKGRVYRILNELIETKYIHRTDVRNEKGVITEWVYEVHEMPRLELLPPKNEPLPQNPQMDNPLLDNADITNYREIQNTDVVLSTEQEMILLTLLSDMVVESPEEIPSTTPQKETAFDVWHDEIKVILSKMDADRLKAFVNEFDEQTVVKLIRLTTKLNGFNFNAFNRVATTYRHKPDRDLVIQAYKLTIEGTGDDKPGQSKVAYFCQTLMALQPEQSNDYTWERVEDDIA